MHESFGDSVKIYKKIQSHFGYFNNFYLVARGCIQQCSSFHWQASFLQFLSYKYFKQLSLVTVPYFCFGFSSLPQESFPRNVLFAERKWFLDSLASFFFIFLLDGIQLITWSISLFFYLVWWLVNVVEGIRVNFLC